MGAGTDLRVNCRYSVPFVWRDAQQGRDRLGFEYEVMPVSIRHVDPGEIGSASLPVEGTDLVQGLSVIEGDLWDAIRGFPVASLMEPGADPLKLPRLPSLGGSTPTRLIPSLALSRRRAAEMLRQAVGYPGEIAAARMLRVVAADYVQDGTLIYERRRTREPGKAFVEGLRHDLRPMMHLVLEAGERAVGAAPSTGLAERLDALLRWEARALLLDVGPADIPDVRRRVGEAAEAVAAAHPLERVRRRMARIAGKAGATAIEGPDDEILAALAP